jgi:uncharacterized protein (UPF0305 family)
MATFTLNNNLTTTEVAQEKFQQERECQLSGEQQEHRKREVQNLALQLRVLLLEGQTPGPEALFPLLLKSEELFARIGQQPDLDIETRKIVEDIAAVVITAKQMERNKGIADRLQRIAEESQKAGEALRRAGLSTETVKASKEVFEFVDTWRPVFQLLSRSREFRELFVDSLTILRRVVSRQAKPIAEEAKERFVEGQSATTIAETAKEEIKEKSKEETPITDEEWESLQDQLQRVLAVLAREPTFRQGINRLFTLFDMFRVTSKQALPVEAHARRLQMEAKELVACFAGRETLDQFEENLKKLIDLFDKNPEWKQFLQELRELILSTKSEEEVKSEEFKQRSKDLANRGRSLIQELKDRDELDDFLRSSNDLIENIKNDEYVKILREQAGIVSADLSYVDTQGKIQIDTDMLSKLQNVLLPVLAETLKYIPLPRIESYDRNRDFWLDNVTLCGFDIIPENIHFGLESDTSLSLKDLESKGSHTRLLIRLDKFRTELKNMKFYYKKKTFPELMDSGIVTLRIGGEGARLNLVFTIDQQLGEVARLTDGYADFHIRQMDIEFDKSTLTHDVLVPMLTTMFKLQIQTHIEKLVENALSPVVQKLSDQLTQTLGAVNRPFLGGIEKAKEAMKATELAQVYNKRREKLME